jgi:hypothetical protein
MTETEELRRLNLNAFCVRKGWVSAKTPDRGSPTKLVELLGRTSSFWSDRLGGTRPIKADLAREIEEAIDGLSQFDLDRIGQMVDARKKVEAPSSPVNTYSDTTLVRAPVVEWARLGEDVLKDPSELGGAEVLDYVQIGTPSRRAKLVPVVDDSLAPRLIVGDMVAIDPDNTSPKRGQVTLFRSSVDGEFFLRRFQPLAHPDFEAVDAKGIAMDSKRYGLEVVGVNCGMRPSDL